MKEMSTVCDHSRAHVLCEKTSVMVQHKNRTYQSLLELSANINADSNRDLIFHLKKTGPKEANS